MDKETQMLIERVRQRRQQLNEELTSSTAEKENMSFSSVNSKRKTEEEMHDSETPSKKSSFNENDLNRQKVPQKLEMNSHQGAKCYPLDELEELARVATSKQASSTLFQKDHKDISGSGFKVSPKSSTRRRSVSSSQALDADTVHKLASGESRKARMAALAARIDSYEDDQCSSSTSSSRRNLKASSESLESFPPPPSAALQTTTDNRRTNEETKLEPQNVKLESGTTHFIRPYYPNTRTQNQPDVVASGILERKNQFFTLANRIGSQSTTNSNKVSSMTSSAIAFQSNFKLENITHDKPSVRILPGLKPRPNPSNTDKKSVAMLRDRWEYATRQGLPLKPEDSFTKADDEITAAALRIFNPVKPPLIPRKMINVNNGPLVLSPKVTGTIKNATEMPEKDGRKPKPGTENFEEPIAILESSVDVQSYTEEETIDENGTEYDTELENCLDQAIDAATKAARDQSTLTHNQNISKNETYLTAFTSHDADSTTHSKLEVPKHLDRLTPTLSSTFLDDSRASMAANTSRMVHTVSMYRQRQKQCEAESLTPVRAVVLPPSSPSGKSQVSKMEKSSRNDNSAPFLHAEVYDNKIKKLNESINIQHEQILQASRALNFCLTSEEFRGSLEEVDAHKVLRVAIERRKAFQEEYERVVKCRSKRQPINNDMDEPRATLTFSYMSLSLKRDFVNDRINTLGEYVYYFMCLIKYREQVLSSQIVDSDAAIRVGGRIEFTNYINLKDVTHDFDIEISVFALRMRREEMSREQKYHSNKTLTLRNKLRPLSASYISSKTSLGGPSTVMDSKFCLCGQLTINKTSVSRQKFALQGYQSNIPIEPVVQLKMRCSAETSGNVEERGFLNLFENVTGLAAWRRFWCLLKDGSLRFWFYPDEETTKLPACTIDLSRCRTKYVEPVSLEICTRPNTFLLDIQDNASQSEGRLLSADDSSSFQTWVESLNRALHNAHLWNSDAQ